jgi:DNA-binding transcriptional LysR family regulator
MDTDALTIRLLRALVTVAREDTFTAAADDLGITQSALSQAMARFETITGAPLFAAEGRTRRLTALGELVADRARTILGMADALSRDVAGLQSGETGRLTVGMIDAVALYLSPDAVTRIKRAHPGAEIGVRVGASTELIDRLLTHELDLVIVVAPVHDGLASRLLVEEPLHVYHAPEPSDAWVLYPSTSHTRAAIDAGLAAAGIVPDVIAESSNPSVLSRLAVLEGAATVLPPTVASSEPGLVDDGPIAHREVHAVWRPGELGPLAEALLRELPGSG